MKERDLGRSATLGGLQIAPGGLRKRTLVVSGGGRAWLLVAAAATKVIQNHAHSILPD